MVKMILSSHVCTIAYLVQLQTYMPVFIININSNQYLNKLKYKFPHDCRMHLQI